MSNNLACQIIGIHSHLLLLPISPTLTTIFLRPAGESRYVPLVYRYIDTAVVEAGIVDADVAKHFTVIGDRLPDHDCLFLSLLSAQGQGRQYI